MCLNHSKLKKFTGHLHTPPPLYNQEDTFQTVM